MSPELEELRENFLFWSTVRVMAPKAFAADLDALIAAARREGAREMRERAADLAYRVFRQEITSLPKGWYDGDTIAGALAHDIAALPVEPQPHE